MNSERYSRQTMLPEIGEEGQGRLASARVAVIGVGGLGSAAATYLAGAGVGELVVVDPDVVSLSNLQRQVLYSECEIGLPKAVCAARRLRALNPEITVIPVAEGLSPENGSSVLKGCDLLMDCTDNYPARCLIDRLCADAGIPWVYGSIGEFFGQLCVMNYRSGVRYSDIFPDCDELCSLPRTTAGVLGAVPGVIGAMQACEAVKLLTGCGDILDGRLFSINLLNYQSETIEFKKI